MRPKKNLFTGTLGKLQNIGGSKAFTIPHTVDVPVQYQVNSNLVGDFVTCSLDGRLWCLKRATRFTFFALKWNPDSHKLEFAASVTRINENILARGLDWILTGKVLVKVLDDSPYITTFNLFSDSSVLTLQDEQTIGHCYSILPPVHEFKVLDDFFTFASQFDDINDFISYLRQFNDFDDFLSSLSHFDNVQVLQSFISNFDSFETLLTSFQNSGSIDNILNYVQEKEHITEPLNLIGEFQIIENFLVRRDNNGNMLSRLIPVEFWQNKALQKISLFNDESSFSPADNHIIAHNSRLWGAGKYALGKVFLLPAVFDSQGKATTFYLYFQHEHKLPRSPRFLRLLIDDLDKLTVTAFEGHSFALIKKSKSWDDAKNDCIARGGHLATATSKAKNDFLVSLANSTLSDTYSIWLGGKSEYPHNNWKWVTGEKWGYENWYNGIDNNYEYLNSNGCGIILDHFYDLLNAWTFEYAHFNLNGLNVEYDGAMRNYYICEWDSLDVYDTWLNHMNDELDSYSLAPAFLGNILHGYKFNSGHNLCSMSDDNSLFYPASGQWLDVSPHNEDVDEISSEHNGNIFFDINQSKAVSLDEKGANFLFNANVRFDCNTLSQWLAPAHSIDAINDNLIVATADNLSIATHPDSNFMREALHNKVLPLSSPIANGYQFSLGHSANSNNRKIIDVNQIESDAAVNQPVLWNKIYKQALDIELINVARDVSLVGNGIAHWDNFDLHAFYDKGVKGMATPFFWGDVPLARILTFESNFKNSALYYDTFSPTYHSAWSSDVITEASVNIYYIDPEDGNVRFFDNIHASFDDYEFHYYPSGRIQHIKKSTFINSVSIIQGKIGFVCETYHLDVNGFVQRTEVFFLPIKDIPDNLLAWCIPNRATSLNDSWLPGSHYSSGRQGLVLDKIENSYALFHETSTNLPFALYCPDAPDINKEVTSFACQEPYSSLESNVESDKKKFLHSLHIAGVMKSEHQIWYDSKGNYVAEVVWDANSNIIDTVGSPNDENAISYNYHVNYDLYIFRSTLHNDFFNFDAELKRSGLS